MELKRPDGNGYKTISLYEDTIEKELPLMWYGAFAFFTLTQLYGIQEKEAKDMSLAIVTEWVNTPCPDFLLVLFDSNSKKAQEKLLRNKSMTPENLICWILQGGRRGGLFSQYSYDSGAPDDLKGRTPILIDATDSEHIRVVGKTDLSDAALLYLVENQKKTIAQFVDFPDGRWYCFYRTHNGLAGRESSAHGQHLHFISSAYGVSRDSIVEGFKKGVCPKNGFHVHLSGFYEDEMAE